MNESIDWWRLVELAGAALGASWLTYLFTVRLYERKRRDQQSDELRNAYAERYSYVDMGFAILLEQVELLGAVTNLEDYEAAKRDFRLRIKGKDYEEINRKASEQYALIMQGENNEERLAEVEQLSNGKWWKDEPVWDNLGASDNYNSVAEMSLEIHRQMMEAIKARGRRATELLKCAG